MSDTPETDAVAIGPSLPVTSDYSQLEIHARKLERENAKLRDALRDADMAICAGQSCRSEAEFTRWMRDSQRYRTHADLIA